MSNPLTPAALAGCYVISLRPVGAHAGLRRVAAMHGARVLALSPWRLQPRDDDATRAALEQARGAEIVIVTSPAAVRAAAALRPLAAGTGQRWIAVGASSARALRRAGIAAAIVPTRMDSDGVLALAELDAVTGTTIGLLTAPGGRDLLAPALRARGATVRRADVYARIALSPSPRAVATLRTLRAPLWLALSSGDALHALLAALPDDAIAALRRARVVAASARLAGLARELGFDDDPVIATDARPRALLSAAATAAASPPIAPRCAPIR